MQKSDCIFKMIMARPKNKYKLVCEVKLKAKALRHFKVETV